MFDIEIKTDRGEKLKFVNVVIDTDQLQRALNKQWVIIKDKNGYGAVQSRKISYFKAKEVS
jgi:hypothetical protein